MTRKQIARAAAEVTPLNEQHNRTPDQGVPG